MDKSEKRFERDIESFLISDAGGYYNLLQRRLAWGTSKGSQSWANRHCNSPCHEYG